MKPYIDLLTAEQIVKETLIQATNKWYELINNDPKIMNAAKKLIFFRTKKYNPTVSFKKIGFRVAGRTIFIKNIKNPNNMTVKIQMNTNYLYSSDYKNFLKYTTLHEFAHFLAFIYDNSTGHNKTWKMIAKFIGDDGKRCHDYASPNNKPVKKVKTRIRHEFICSNCGKKYYLTNLMVNRIKNNPFDYTCNCGNYASNFVNGN